MHLVGNFSKLKICMEKADKKNKIIYGTTIFGSLDFVTIERRIIVETWNFYQMLIIVIIIHDQTILILFLLFIDIYDIKIKIFEFFKSVF